MATLVTIPVSNYVEKARWALQLAGVAFTENKYAPLFAYVATMPNGGKSVPLLVLPASPTSDGTSSTTAPATVLTDSSAILDFCATKLPSLYPTPETKALELKFDKELGPSTRCVVFMDPAASREVLTEPLGFTQRHVARLCFPLLKIIILRGLHVTAAAAERAWKRVENVVAFVDALLGDAPIGSRFLAGDSFSAADIAFCAHMSLLLFPVQHCYLHPVMSLERIHAPVFRERLATLQTTRAAQFVYWCYAHKRPRMQLVAKL